MFKSKKLAGAIAAAVFGIAGAQAASAAVVITQWSFGTATAAQGSAGTVLTAAPDNSPAPSTGSGVATVLGMDSTASVPSADVLASPGVADTSFNEFTWRGRGAAGATSGDTNTYPANGWSNSAPNYTQGAEFAVSTVGYAPTSFSFDWYSTKQAPANLQLRYTLDGSTWNNLGTDLIATPNDFYGGASGSPTNTVDLSSISATATNDADFAVELVSRVPVTGDSDYSATGPGGDGNYAAASGGDYNNNSGNWRFDNITLSGSAVPKPASASLLALSGVALLGRRRKAK